MSQHGLGKGLQLVDGNGFVLVRGASPSDLLAATLEKIWNELPSGRIFTRTSGTPSSSCRAVQFARLSS